MTNKDMNQNPILNDSIWYKNLPALSFFMLGDEITVVVLQCKFSFGDTVSSVTTDLDRFSNSGHC